MDVAYNLRLMKESKCGCVHNGEYSVYDGNALPREGEKLIFGEEIYTVKDVSHEFSFILGNERKNTNINVSKPLVIGLCKHLIDPKTF